MLKGVYLFCQIIGVPASFSNLHVSSRKTSENQCKFESESSQTIELAQHVDFGFSILFSKIY